MCYAECALPSTNFYWNICENSRHFTRQYLLSTAEQTLGVGLPSPRLKLEIEDTGNSGLFRSTETNHLCEGMLSNSKCDAPFGYLKALIRFCLSLSKGRKRRKI